MNRESLTIGQLARRAGVGVETVRFYERRGLIEEPPRDPASGYRRYPEGAVARIRFIRHAKDLGFSLKEIDELLRLRIDPSTSCEEVLRRAETKIADIEAKVAILRRMKAVLEDLVRACRETCRTPSSRMHCPILDALEEDE